MPYLIVVSGAPASGKTTISRRLEVDLSVPLIAKDDIKEMLFDHLEQHDRDWSTTEGKMAIAMMYAGAEVLLAEGYHVMIESSFNRDYSIDEIDTVCGRTGANVIEVYCRLDHTLRQERWTARTLSGDRHPGHLDDPAHTISQRPVDAPLYSERAEVIDTSMSPEEYEQRYKDILALMAMTIGKEGRYETTN